MISSYFQRMMINNASNEVIVHNESENRILVQVSPNVRLITETAQSQNVSD